MSSQIGITNFQPSASRSSAELFLVPQAERRTNSARFRSRVAIAEAVVDFGTVIAAVMLSYVLYYRLGVGKHLYYPHKVVFGVSASLAGAIVLMLDRVGAYSGCTSLLRVRETEHLLRASVQALGIAFGVSFFTNFLFSRWLLILTLFTLPLFLIVDKFLVFKYVQRLHAKGHGIERVLIYGSGATGRRVYSVLSRSPKLGLEPVALVDENPAKEGSAVFELGYERRRASTVVRGPLTCELVRRYAADLVIIAIPSLAPHKFHRAVREATAARASVSFVPNNLMQAEYSVDFRDVDGVMLASVSDKSQRRTYHWAKRALDFAGAAALLLFCAPLFLIIAVLIHLDSRGPALFCQERIGINGRQFRMFKFRTMYCDAPPYAYSPRASHDPRITRIGAFLRRTSLDELPQLLNVLEGSMSLVGPRPEMPFIVQQYGELHRQRLQVKPGITGLWQLSGDRAYLIHENIDYDLYYIRNRNLFMDLAILLHTTIFAMRGV